MRIEIRMTDRGERKFKVVEGVAVAWYRSAGRRKDGKPFAGHWVDIPRHLRGPI